MAKRTPEWFKPNGGMNPSQIRHLLKQRGVTIAAFAAELHASRGVVERTIRRRSKNPIVRRLLSLFLNLSEAELFGSSHATNRKNEPTK